VAAAVERDRDVRVPHIRAQRLLPPATIASEALRVEGCCPTRRRAAESHRVPRERDWSTHCPAAGPERETPRAYGANLVPLRGFETS
jgi:hypothetical protein